MNLLDLIPTINQFFANEGKMIDSEALFERDELKFVISKKVMSSILKEVEVHLAPSYNGNDVNFTLVESIYIDTKELDTFKDHLKGEIERFKLRLRRYAPGGEWSDGHYLLEIKFKKEGKTKKRRIFISENEKENIFKWKTFSENQKAILKDQIVLLNQKINPKIPLIKLIKRIDLISELFSLKELVPSIQVIYKRKAYQDSISGDPQNNGVRVTFDSDIEGKILISQTEKNHLNFLQAYSDVDRIWMNEMVSKYDSKNDVLMELKIANTIPDWLLKLIMKYNLEEKSFSKYCFFNSKIILKSDFNLKQSNQISETKSFFRLNEFAI